MPWTPPCCGTAAQATKSSPSKRNLATPPRTPPPPPCTPAPAIVDQLTATVGHVNLASAFSTLMPPTQTFTPRHLLLLTVIRVPLVYLVPTQHFSRYFAHVSANGMMAIFGIQIPAIFDDVLTHALTELDPQDQDYATIVLVMWDAANIIAQVHEDFNNILPPGQLTPLPFPCMQGPVITHVLQLSDNRLYKQLAGDPNSNPQGLHQFLSIVRVEYKGRERAHLGTALGGVQVICQAGQFSPATQAAMAQLAAL